MITMPVPEGLVRKQPWPLQSRESLRDLQLVRL